jgi:NTP pyrophosphatase (non-canonical NTP hydrolase)
MSTSINRTITFATLRDANVARLPRFKNKKGLPAHSQPDGSDWALSTWCNAVLGELGELANLIKKVERGDLTLDEAREVAGKECADVATYLDILAYKLGVDLGQAVMDKFNEVSHRVDAGVYIEQGVAPPALDIVEAAVVVVR